MPLHLHLLLPVALRRRLQGQSLQQALQRLAARWLVGSSRRLSLGMLWLRTLRCMGTSPPCLPSRQTALPHRQAPGTSLFSQPRISWQHAPPLLSSRWTQGERLLRAWTSLQSLQLWHRRLLGRLTRQARAPSPL